LLNRVWTTGRSAIFLLAAVLAFGPVANASQTANSGTLPLRSDAPLASDPVDLAARYETGVSVPQDYRRALALYCQAARNGDPRAYFALGWMYLNGRGVARDDASAVAWLRKAAAHGITQATNLLTLLPSNLARNGQQCPTGVASIANLTAPPAAVRALIDETAHDTGLDPTLLQSVMAVESGYNPRAVSPKMAVGLMQLMPATAARLGVQDSFDERENVHAGATYLRSLLQMFNGDLTLALAAYNAGEAAVLSHGGVPPYRETLDYIATVKRLCACGN
jgi:soluble lytic murein transglycosylase-like protein